MNKSCRLFAVIVIFTVLITGCTPKVQIEAPEKPITINLNVKIEHEIRVKVDKDLDEMFSGKSGLPAIAGIKGRLPATGLIGWTG